MPTNPHPRAAFTDDLVDEVADVFVQERGVEREEVWAWLHPRVRWAESAVTV